MEQNTFYPQEKKSSNAPGCVVLILGILCTITPLILYFIKGSPHIVPADIYAILPSASWISPFAYLFFENIYLILHVSGWGLIVIALLIFSLRKSKEVPVAPPVMPVLYCPSCGRPYTSGSVFCQSCGRQLPVVPQAAMPPQPATSSEKEQNGFLQSGLGALIAFCLTLLSLWILKTYASGMSCLIGSSFLLAVIHSIKSIFPVLIIVLGIELILFFILPLFAKKNSSLLLLFGSIFTIIFSTVCAILSKPLISSSESPELIDLMYAYVPFLAASIPILFGAWSLNAYTGWPRKSIITSILLFVLNIALYSVLGYIFVMKVYLGCQGMGLAHLVSSIIIYVIVIVSGLL